jgi:LysM repeat protein
MTFAEKQALSPPAQQKAEQGEERQAKGSRYAVRKGDTLGKIAETFGVTAQQIRNWNGLHASTIHVGLLLLIRTEPPPTAARQVASAPTVRKPGSEAEVLVYKVRRGDTLWEIARTHNVEPRDIKSWNDITRNKIYAGQELIIHPAASDMRQ